MTTKKRTQSIDDLRSNDVKCMIATTLADEGLDVPTLDSVIMAGGGASATRVNQRIGRTLRKDKKGKKKMSIVVMYEHNAKHLVKHATKVRRLIKKEPEFEIVESKGLDFIIEEIEDLVKNKNSETIFDV
jgi:superfamily II DNA or RNA helicase